MPILSRQIDSLSVYQYYIYIGVLTRQSKNTISLMSSWRDRSKKPTIINTRKICRKKPFNHNLTVIIVTWIKTVLNSQVNFLLCQLAALFLASLYRNVLHPSQVSCRTRHTFALTLGLCMGYFTFGDQAVHIGMWVNLEFGKVNAITLIFVWRGCWLTSIIICHYVLSYPFSLSSRPLLRMHTYAESQEHPKGGDRGGNGLLVRHPYSSPVLRLWVIFIGCHLSTDDNRPESD